MYFYKNRINRPKKTAFRESLAIAANTLKSLLFPFFIFHIIYIYFMYLFNELMDGYYIANLRNIMFVCTYSIHIIPRSALCDVFDEVGVTTSGYWFFLFKHSGQMILQCILQWGFWTIRSLGHKPAEVVWFSTVSCLQVYNFLSNHRVFGFVTEKNRNDISYLKSFRPKSIVCFLG